MRLLILGSQSSNRTLLILSKHLLLIFAKALQDTLLGQHVADPVTAIISGLLLRVDGLAALNLDPVALQHAQARAREVSAGGWADRSKTTEVNLEVTAAAVLPALG